MAFTRFHDDPARIKKQLQESTDAGRWHINVPGNGTHPGFSEDPQCRLQKWGANLRTNVVDVQSDLMGLTRNLNRDTIDKNIHYATSTHSTKIEYPNHKSYTDESRSTHPAWMYRDLEQTNYAILPLDPQEHTCIPFANNVSSRILEKDNYKPKIPVLKDEIGNPIN